MHVTHFARTSSSQAATRTQLLETSVNEATKYEVNIVNIQQWIEGINQLLINRLDNDLTAQDLPEDHQVWKCSNKEKFHL